MFFVHVFVVFNEIKALFTANRWRTFWVPLEKDQINLDPWTREKAIHVNSKQKFSRHHYKAIHDDNGSLKATHVYERKLKAILIPFSTMILPICPQSNVFSSIWSIFRSQTFLSIMNIFCSIWNNFLLLRTFYYCIKHFSFHQTFFVRGNVFQNIPTTTRSTTTVKPLLGPLSVARGIKMQKHWVLTIHEWIRNVFTL